MSEGCNGRLSDWADKDPTDETRQIADKMSVRMFYVGFKVDPDL